MKRALKLMWHNSAAFAEVQYQVSQIHLCADIANWQPSSDNLSRLVTRSRQKTTYFTSADDVPSALQDAIAETLADPFDFDSVPDEWGAVPDDGEDQDHDEEEYLAEEDGAVVHHWGQRAATFAFSLKASVAMVWYNKLLRADRRRFVRFVEVAGVV